MIKKILILAVFIAIANAKVNVIVSIAPLEFFAKSIAKNLANIKVMVKPGFSPATYEPKPSELKALKEAQLYFAIGVLFEKAYLKRFKKINPNIKIIPLQKGAKFIKLVDKNGIKSSANDPHIWMSIDNVKNIIAKNIVNAFIKIDPVHKKEYQKNYNTFIQKLQTIDKKIKKILKNKKNKTFAVFHPTFGYFAKEYGLIQIPIEAEGKEPGLKTLMRLIKKIKKEKIKLIITQPEFSKKAARLIAKETKTKLISLSALTKEWDKNMLKLAKVLSENY